MAKTAKKVPKVWFCWFWDLYWTYHFYSRVLKFHSLIFNDLLLLFGAKLFKYFFSEVVVSLIYICTEYLLNRLNTPLYPTITSKTYHISPLSKLSRFQERSKRWIMLHIRPEFLGNLSFLDFGILRFILSLFEVSKVLNHLLAIDQFKYNFYFKLWSISRAPTELNSDPISQNWSILDQYGPFYSHHIHSGHFPHF